jgi:hypothetical protein
MLTIDYHSGIYNADNGTHPTEGAPAAIVGPFVSIDGHLRSPYYNTLKPSDAPTSGMP